MSNHPIDGEMPAEIDFGKATRGRHHIPAEAAVVLPAGNPLTTRPQTPVSTAGKTAPPPQTP
jgi:hypothetical protein